MSYDKVLREESRAFLRSLLSDGHLCTRAMKPDQFEQMMAFQTALREAEDNARRSNPLRVVADNSAA